MKKLITKVQNNLSHSINQPQNMRKFYKESTFCLNPNPSHPLHKYLIKLDDKVMRTPYRHMLAVPNQTLAFLITSQFNRQEKYLKTGQMPILGLCRTAVDADLQGNISHHLKDTIVQYLKTDTLNFHEDYYSQKYEKIARPYVNSFSKHFQMEIQPSCTLEPPKIQISDNFSQWLESLTNWELLGMQTMTVWLKSTISAFQMTQIKEPKDIQIIQEAVTIQEMTQMKQSGEVEQKIMQFNQIRLMANCGLIMFQHGNQKKQ